MQMKNWSPRRKAKYFAELLGNGCDGRRLDDCFENGQGAQVVAEFVTLYNNSAQLRDTCRDYQAGRQIGWSDWLETAGKNDVHLDAAPLDIWLECASTYNATVSVPTPHSMQNLFTVA